MNKNTGLNTLMEKIKNKEPLKLDLENGIVLDLNWKEDKKAYQGYSKDMDMEVGLWLQKTLIQIATESGWNCHIVVD